MKERFKSTVCVDVLIHKKIKYDDYILLMKRKNTGYNDGEYELPGGHLEKNEDIYDAMIREIKEELFLDINKSDLELIYLLHHYTGERLNFIFKMDGNNIIPKIGEKEKCDELVWVKIDCLPDKTTEKVKLIIKDIVNNKMYNCI